MSAFSKAVQDDAEMKRVAALPRRSPVPPEGLAEDMTEALKREGGTMTLRPLQALALHDIALCNGGYLLLDVGEGKTLVSLLAPYVLNAQRPLLLLPGHLIKKTRLERDELEPHWPIPRNIMVMSYQLLGQVQAEEAIEESNPDLIIFDESHRTKNADAAVSRRLERYMRKRPDTRVVAMTGTSMRKSFTDCAHAIRWALKDKAPVPRDDYTTSEWALCLDSRIENEFQRLKPGPLLALATDEERATLTQHVAARRGFRRRLLETPGVVSSAPSGAEVEAGLRIRALRYDMAPVTTEHFRRLRKEWVTPDGWQLMQPTEVWRHARELALGFHQVWEPRPPIDWMKARREWAAFVRDVLSRSRTLDSPKQVKLMVQSGQMPRGDELLRAWEAVEPSYTIRTAAVWHDVEALRAAAQWMSEPGIVWVEHVEFGKRLADFTGAKYYGAEGLASDGAFIDDADADSPIIASAKANREGRNLQRKYWRNLITTMTESADQLHQLVGRTHRSKQRAPEVIVDVLLGCAEHAKAWATALAAAACIQDTVGSQNKLLIANIEWPASEDIASWTGPRWEQ